MTIQVRSNVSRDLLQSAAVFNSVPKVVWEYVSNSLDNPRPGRPVVVVVRIGRDELTVEDSGVGMSRADLRRFFEMHGPNVARQQGRTVRGRFGTGKSAAFGIANYLRVETVRDGLLNAVELQRSRIEQARDGEPFPVTEVIRDERTEREPGTKIQVREINIEHLEIERTRRYVERNLRRQHQAHEVYVNNHLCEARQIPSVAEHTFEPPDELKPLVGEGVALVVRVSPEPLDSEDLGIAIFSRGVWHETTLGDQGGRPFSEYLFGEVDVPVLEEEEGPIPAFDNTRSGQLNRAHPLVVRILGWISRSLEGVRRELLEEDRKQRQTDMARQLEEQADRIADVLNEDFRQWARELARAQATARAVEAGTSVPTTAPDDETVSAVVGGDLPLPETPDDVGVRLPPGGGKEHSPLTGSAPQGTDLPLEQGAAGTPESGSGGGPARRQRSRSGFSIVFRHTTEDANRSRFVPASRTIVINLDHPLVRGALGAEGGVEGRTFRQLSYEIALTEYSFALGFDVAQREGESYTPYVALSDAINTVNRVSRLVARAAYA